MNNIWTTIKSDCKKRNPLTNFVLYSIQIASLVAIIAILPGIVWSIGKFDDFEWNVWDVYGEGFIPEFFACISVFICNILILRWKKIGFSVMLISFFVICLPVMICEYELFVAYLSFLYVGLLIYWLSLQFKRKGISTWKQCLGDFKVVNRAILAIAIFLTVILPPLIGYAIGFKGELYSKGCHYVDAHLAPHCYYKNRMARDIAFSSLWRKDELSRFDSAEDLFLIASSDAEEEYLAAWYLRAKGYRKEWDLKNIFSSHICFLLKEEKTEEAKKVYQHALEYYETVDLRKEIESDDILKSYLADYDAFVNNLVSTKFILTSCNQKQDFQDAGKYSSDEFLQALYHNNIPDFPYIGKTQELNEAFFTEKCISLLRENYEYDGDGLAVWDLFGGSNTNVWGSFKDMRYYQDGWYVLSFVYEEYWGDKEDEYYISDAPDLYLRVIQRKGRWVIDEYKLR